MQVNNVPDKEWLGTRDFLNDEGQSYTWKTFREVNRLVDALSCAMQKNDVMPLI
jgi:hypothetical protein